MQYIYESMEKNTRSATHLHTAGCCSITEASTAFRISWTDSTFWCLTLHFWTHTQFLLSTKLVTGLIHLLWKASFFSFRGSATCLAEDIYKMSYSNKRGIDSSQEQISHRTSFLFYLRALRLRAQQDSSSRQKLFHPAHSVCLARTPTLRAFLPNDIFWLLTSYLSLVYKM